VPSHSRALSVRWITEILVIAIVYLAAARLRLVFPFNDLGASWMWLPSGVGLAALLLRGVNRWPGIALASIVLGTMSHRPWFAVAISALGGVGEAVLAWALITHWGPFDVGLRSVKDVIRLIVASLVSASIAAVPGTWALNTLSHRSFATFGAEWLAFFGGDALGILALTPTLLVWIGTRVSFPRTVRRLEFAVMLAATFTVGLLVFAQAVWPVNVLISTAFLSFPLMVWSAFRFGQPGVTGITSVLGTFALAGSARGLGPLAHAMNRGEALMVAGFMNVVGVTALTMAAVVQERARAQAEHRATDARFRAFMHFSPAIAYMKTTDGVYVFGNEAWARQFGKPVSELIGSRDTDLWPPETAARFRASDAQTLASHEPIEMTEFGPGQDGSVHWWTTLKFAIEQETGGPLVGGITIDITPRMRAEQALRASEDRYRSLVELAGSVIVVVGPDGRIAEFNRSAEALFAVSRDAAIGRDFLELCVPRDQWEHTREALEQIRSGEAIRENELLLPTAGKGTPRSFLWNATRLLDGPSNPGGVLIIGQDITELRRLETQLLLSQRMEGIGRLAGGIAHDFNNLLTAILGHAEMARFDVAPGDPAQTNIAEITRAAQRAADLTRQLLAFARRQIIEPKIVDLNALLLNVQKMLGRLLGEDVTVVTRPDPDLWRVRIDPGQFEQVLVNLAVNARDAMPQGGELRISTHNVHLDADFARAHATVQPGPHVLLRVVDTGTGMDEEVLAHIFEPFFTTKEVGKGTGLGLATCYGIVKQNRGSIWVQSSKGQGTTFEIYLPKADAPLDQALLPERYIASRISGSETVLLVEDEAVVRDLAADALRRHGYQVLTATTGAEALALARQVLRSLDALVTDVVMPQMGGQQLAEELLATRPDLKVLYISGYTETPLDQRDLTPGIALLQKPFTPGQLVQRVREMLDGSRGSAQGSLPLSH
jgi:PAS domain S-box-containing protein